jgi:hypothetical protein
MGIGEETKVDVVIKHSRRSQLLKVCGRRGGVASTEKKDRYPA